MWERIAAGITPIRKTSWKRRTQSIPEAISVTTQEASFYVSLPLLAPLPPQAGALSTCWALT